MQYANVNGIKSLPERGKTGVCYGCLQEVISKCGIIKVHHWAHKRTDDCDTWSEPESEWHREWKNQFPERYREISFPDGNIFHRADIHTEKGITIEFQNSPLSVEEFNQRNIFYQKLIWVVNGLKFERSFTLDRRIPNPNHPILEDFEIRGKMFFKREDVAKPRILARPWLADRIERLVLTYGLNSPELKGLELSDEHYAFTWSNKRKIWFQSNALVFLDFGDEYLGWLRKREQNLEDFWYIQKIKKSDFIKKYSE